jgi:HEAT repeat protein
MMVLLLSLGLLFVTATGAAAGSVPAAPGAGPVTEVRVDNGRLSVRLQDAPLGDLLRIIGQQAGLTVTLRGDFSRPVTLSFENVPMEEAIRRLVRGDSVAFSYADAANPRQAALSGVWVLGATPGGEPQVVVEAAPPTSPSEVAAGAPSPDATDGSAPVPGGSNADRTKRAASDRIRAIQDLARTEGVAAASALHDALRHENEARVRLAAVGALASMRTEEARAGLESAAKDPDPRIRQVVELALARFGPRAP